MSEGFGKACWTHTQYLLAALEIRVCSISLIIKPEDQLLHTLHM